MLKTISCIGISFIFLFIGSSAIQAQDYDPILFDAKMEMIDAWVSTQIDHEQIPGMSISIFNRDSILWEKGYGYSNLTGKKEMTPNTPLRTCSISKLFTALQVMQLYQNQTIDIEAPLTNYLAGFSPLINERTPTGAVTFKNVLTHTSGLPTEANIPYFINFKYPRSEALLTDMNSNTLLSEPDSVFRYSNLGYSLAGVAISQITGMPFNESVQKNIIEPLGLSNTYSDINQMIDTGELGRGYGVRREEEREVFAHYNTKALSPAAGLISTTHDLAILGNWIFKVSLQSDELFNSDIINSMIHPAWEDSLTGNKRGLGFRYYYDGDKTYFGHGGYCSGYRAVLMMDEYVETGVSIIMNVNDYSPYDVAFTILSLLDMKIYYESDSNFELTKLEGIYDRKNMPIRSVISALPNKLLVMSLYSTRPDESLWVLTPNDSNPLHFEKEGSPAEGALYFATDEEKEELRFYRFYNYLTRIKN